MLFAFPGCQNKFFCIFGQNLIWIIFLRNFFGHFFCPIYLALTEFYNFLAKKNALPKLGLFRRLLMDLKSALSLLNGFILMDQSKRRLRSPQGFAESSEKKEGAAGYQGDRAGVRYDDWYCHRCDYEVFAKWNKCPKCGTPRTRSGA